MAFTGVLHWRNLKEVTSVTTFRVCSCFKIYCHIAVSYVIVTVERFSGGRLFGEVCRYFRFSK